MQHTANGSNMNHATNRMNGTDGINMRQQERLPLPGQRQPAAAPGEFNHKTKMCRAAANGEPCCYGDRCRCGMSCSSCKSCAPLTRRHHSFAHSQAELNMSRRPAGPPSMNTNMCINTNMNMPSNASQSPHPLKKTKMCRRIVEDGFCRFGDMCGCVRPRPCQAFCVIMESPIIGSRTAVKSCEHLVVILVQVLRWEWDVA